MLINLIDARRGLHEKCMELFADKNIAEQIYRKLCEGIDDCEAAEKTELVRCKDCKHWNGETHGCTRNPSVEPWFESDYCNYGARMED